MSEWIGLGTLMLGVCTALITAIVRWGKAVEERAYERSRNEALLREAQATIYQISGECDSAKDKIVARDKEIRRLHGVIQSLRESLAYITGSEES